MEPGRNDEHVERVTSFVLSRPIASTIFAIFAMYVVVQTLRFIEPETGALDNPVAWLALVTLVYTPFLVVFLPRLTKQSSDKVLMLRWSVGYTPFLLAFVSVMSKGPAWLIGAGFVETMVLLVFSIGSAKKTAVPREQHR